MQQTKSEQKDRQGGLGDEGKGFGVVFLCFFTVALLVGSTKLQGKREMSGPKAAGMTPSDSIKHGLYYLLCPVLLGFCVVLLF